MNFYDKIYEVVKDIPKGMVATYGQVAFLAGNPRASRVVGWALHKNPEFLNIPCHRIVFADGRLASGFVFGGPDVQRDLLEAEGVGFLMNGKVDLETHLWQKEIFG